MANFNQNIKIGLLGGGQLGKMLLQSAADFNLNISVLDPDKEAPCSKLTPDFFVGNLMNYNDVYEFGKNKDLITIEIEHINIDALLKLKQDGIEIYPDPEVLHIIQDKGLQKLFFSRNNIPTAEYILCETAEELSHHMNFLPAFQKLRKMGYDGRGVVKIEGENDFNKSFSEPFLLEKKVEIEKEIAVICARSKSGEIKTFPVVEMHFDDQQNLVDHLIAPARITIAQEQLATAIAVELTEKLNTAGILAVEMFLDVEGRILVNELAPRPHNSGHHTIKANSTSQFEQHLRAILDLPLGSTAATSAAAMINILGAAGYEGDAVYEGINDILSLNQTYIHLYGKKKTRPFRKMGHIIICGEEIKEIEGKITFVKDKIRVIA